MRYLGGKSKLIRKFSGILDDALLGHNGRFVEPFVGGCNVIGSLRNVGTAHCYDINSGIIGMYNAFIGGWNPPNKISENEYDGLKLACGSDPLSVFASFGCTFSGIEWGTYARCKKGHNYAAQSARSLERSRGAMRAATFRALSYADVTIAEPSVIYCDPPYNNTHGYKTGKFDSTEFFHWSERQSAAGNVVFVSELNGPSHWDVVWEHERTMLDRRGKCVEKLYRVPS